MFKEAVIYYPMDENTMKRISKELAAFRCAAIVKYIGSLELDDRQVAVLIAAAMDDVCKKNPVWKDGLNLMV